MNFLSTGGLGDSFISYLKILDWQRKNSNEFVNWKHIESNIHVPNLVCEYIHQAGPLRNEMINVVGEFDPEYIKRLPHDQRLWRYPFQRLSSKQYGFCQFHGETPAVENPFLEGDHNSEIKYDICLQVSAGIKNNRGWKFDPLGMPNIIEQLFKKTVCLIGNDPKFASDERNNFVCRQDLNKTLETIQKSKIVIAPSGFLSYVSMSMKKTVIHYFESEEHDERYINPAWELYRHKVEMGVAGEILPILRDIFNSVRRLC